MREAGGGGRLCFLRGSLLGWEPEGRRQGLGLSWLLGWDLAGLGVSTLNVMLIPVPAGRPCVDCHAFEFMQRALQDLRKTAYSLDARVSTQGQGGLAIVISIPRPSHSRDLGAELTWKRPHAQLTV